MPAVFDPVYNAYFYDPQNPLLVWLPEEPLPESAQMAYLVGNYQGDSGVRYEFFCYRARKLVHVYELLSHGRRFYRSLTYTNDARFCLRSLQPSRQRFS